MNANAVLCIESVHSASVKSRITFDSYLSTPHAAHFTKLLLSYL